jgi:hypothetical protein
MAQPTESQPSTDELKEALLETMTLMCSQLTDVARTDATRRAIIDDMTHNTYTHPLDADRRVQSASDALINACHKRIVEQARKITILAPTHTRETYVARPAQNVPTSGDRLTPAAFLEAYELLYVETYGSGAIFQDENAIHGAGKAVRGRTKSTDVETRGGAVQKKKLSASQKNVVKSQRAFNQKTKIDKRLRKMGKEILDYLNKEAQNQQNFYMRCAKCKKHAEDEWEFCPRCGSKTEKVTKE